LKQDEETARRQKEDEEKRKREEEERKRREEEERRRREQEEAERQRQEEERRRREEEERERREREEAERRRQEEEAQRAAAAQTPAAASTPSTVSAGVQPAASAPAAQGSSADQVSPQAKLEYEQKLENLKRVADIIVPMENHPRKRDMFRIINTGVFQICSNRVQVLQKITDFTKILTESKADDVVHNYCLNLMAQKFLEQADIVVSRKPESAFAVAMVAVNVAKSHPALMDLLIGQLYNICPYAVPYYLPRPQGMSDQDYAITVLKYKKKPNNPEGRETIEEYYERMSGMIYLYSAMMITPVTDGNHPFGIEHAWRWLARVLNLKPRRITPVLLLAFLEHTSYFLAAKYGRQFSKLLLFIRDDYLRRLPTGTTASKTRLELFLGDWEQNGGRFSEPNGYRYE
jgi:nucleoporin GLE1